MSINSSIFLALPVKHLKYSISGYGFTRIDEFPEGDSRVPVPARRMILL